MIDDCPQCELNWLDAGELMVIVRAPDHAGDLGGDSILGIPGRCRQPLGTCRRTSERLSGPPKPGGILIHRAA